MNTKAEVMQAFEDFQKGRMGQVPAVHGLDRSIREVLSYRTDNVRASGGLPGRLRPLG